MKQLLTAILLAIVFIGGCDQSSDPVTGPTPQDKIMYDGAGITNRHLNYDMIPLPRRSPIFLDSIFSVTQLINGLTGGIITLEASYISDKGSFPLVTMLVTLLIPPLSFNGQRTITMTIDSGYAVIHCNPSMNFNHPLIMTQTFTGVDLSEYNPQDIDFVYLNDNGSIEDINHGLMVIEPLTGTLSVISAQIPHFSRYGWVRKH